MLQLSFIRENKELTIKGLHKKRVKNPEQIIDDLLALDNKRRETQTERDGVLARSNSISKEIGGLMKAGKKEEAEAMKAETSLLKAKEKELTELLNDYEAKLTQMLYQIPNLPHETVPEGAGAEDNEVVFLSQNAQNLPVLEGNPLPHWDLIKKYDIIDFDLGVKISGAGFPVYKGKGARLQRALVNFFLDEAIKAGYTEIQPPIVVNEDSGYGTGQLPDKEGQMYFINADGLYLIPTAEVPITNLYRDVIVKDEDLPIKNVGFTPCFRREAGSWGAHVRGLNRLHQFDKVEIVQITKPEDSYKTHQAMCDYVAGILDKLELPYRILRLCGGDISFNAALCHDFEVYSAAQQRWLEVSSVSNFETFQANRLKLRYKDENGKTQLLHTLNGSALALPRILAALLENNQTNEGIKLPKIIHAYTGFDIIN
ncbi:serine--tRNA ligase [Thermoflexibacter ruber]|uniref:Serine--tRNA ligase n=1 Tax=Thermoflexibacter ruber TaxID=1003 RepID=A0A1I2AYH8_9BACT|nr:serine--tRNA ligase [Thermoflexibacter ruber]SFE48043.1 seryl-tRNA synthetase [Thermoflexibacter ruber]